ncbi:unnamed protein product [Closterium sp. Naga37s-1]|nr:unnamed protein product [Closterium sp. Naga37s-1]
MGVSAGIAAQGMPFDLRLAVLLGGFAFEAYSTPTGSDKLSDEDGRQCSALFTSTPFAHELFQGQLSMRAITATGNIKALHAELALVTSAGKAATWNGVAHTTVKAQDQKKPSWPEQLQLLVLRAAASDTFLQVVLCWTQEVVLCWSLVVAGREYLKPSCLPLCLLSSPPCQQITFHSKDDDKDSDEDDCVVGTATIALTDLIKGGGEGGCVGVWRDKDPRRKRLVVSSRGTEVVNAAMLKDGQAGQKIKDALTDLRLHKEK